MSSLLPSKGGEAPSNCSQVTTRASAFPKNTSNLCGQFSLCLRTGCSSRILGPLCIQEARTVWKEERGRNGLRGKRPAISPPATLYLVTSFLSPFCSQLPAAPFAHCNPATGIPDGCSLTVSHACISRSWLIFACRGPPLALSLGFES